MIKNRTYTVYSSQKYKDIYGVHRLPIFIPTYYWCDTSIPSRHDDILGLILCQVKMHSYNYTSVSTSLIFTEYNYLKIASKEIEQKSWLG